MANKDFKVKNNLVVGDLTTAGPIVRHTDGTLVSHTSLPIDKGGTGQTTATNALNALLPLQTDNANKVLKTDGTNTSWVAQPNGYTIGNTASRPASPVLGQIYSNTETASIEFYTSSGWIGVSPTPSAPTIGTVTVAGLTASVPFTYSGSVPVTSYTVTSSPGSLTATGSSSPISVSGLSP